MEQHPVPQNVTTFQFRLIGDMTLKQFAYLAAGAIMAYIFFKLPLPFFFTWPLSLVAAIGGFGLAFVPVEERPMDVWVLAFFKNVYSPTQFVWQRRPPAPEAPKPVPPVAARPSRSRPLAEALQQFFTFKTAAPPPPVPPEAGPARLPAGTWPAGTWPVSGFPKTPAPSVTGRRLDFSPPPKVVPPPSNLQAVEEAKARTTFLEKRLQQLQEELKTKTVTEGRILELQQQLTQILEERNKMEGEILTLRQKLQQGAGPMAAPMRPAATAIPSPSPTVRVMTGQTALKAGLPRLTTFPNVASGIIKDTEGNLLPGILVTIRDKDDVPLRALKTNKLGQFAASTPLPNGVYLVEIEDPRGRFVFDRIQITLTGGVLPALEIIAKSQKEITRERLTQEIFGNQTI